MLKFDLSELEEFFSESPSVNSERLELISSKLAATLGSIVEGEDSLSETDIKNIWFDSKLLSRILGVMAFNY